MGGSHESSSLMPVIFSFLAYSILELARHFDQTKDSRFLLTNSLNVISWRPRMCSLAVLSGPILANEPGSDKSY
jgi:hypothetical protein